MSWDGVKQVPYPCSEVQRGKQGNHGLVVQDFQVHLSLGDVFYEQESLSLLLTLGSSHQPSESCFGHRAHFRFGLKSHQEISVRSLKYGFDFGIACTVSRSMRQGPLQTLKAVPEKHGPECRC